MHVQGTGGQVGIVNRYFGPKSARNREYWLIIPYLCKQSHVNYAWVSSYKTLGLFVVMRMHRQDTGGQIGMGNRYFGPQKSPKSWILAIKPYLCAQSQVNHIWVSSYKQLGQLVIIYMHKHDTGSQEGTENRYFGVQKCPKSWIFGYNARFMRTKSCKTYTSQLL